MRPASSAFSGLSAYQDAALALGSGGEPERINGMLVSGNYFQVLGSCRPPGGSSFPKRIGTRALIRSSS